MSRQEYLEQRIKTASSAQLHLMLLEGGMRFALQGDKRFEENDVEGAARPLLKAMDIASELLAGVKHSTDEINLKLADLYQFVFTRLTMAYVNSDRQKLHEAIRVLEFQRDTWRQACEKIAGGEAEAPAGEKLRGPHKPAPLAAPDIAAGGGLSLEA